MNGFAGIYGPAALREHREAALHRAFGTFRCTPAIVHTSNVLTIGWTSDPSRCAFARSAEATAMVYGSAHADAATSDGKPMVDDIEGFAHLLLRDAARASPRGWAGSFLAAVERAGSLMLFGDRAGNRPCYTAANRDELVFASHPLLCARLLEGACVDRELEEFLLVYGFYPDGRTAYRGVRQIPAGRVLAHGSAGTAETATAPESVPPADPPQSDTAVFDQLYETMLTCTSQQTAASEDAAVLLGGFDSALIAALLHRLGKRVHTYSFRYQDGRYNQPHTDTLARFLDCTHTWVDISPEIIGTGLDDYAIRYIQPTNWMNYLIQTTHVCNQMRRDGHRHAWSGDGCDAVFLGYPGTYRRTRNYARLPRLPGALAGALVTMFGHGTLDRLMGHPYRVAMGMLRALALPLPDRAFLTFRVMDQITISALRGNDPANSTGAIDELVHRLAQPYSDTSLERLGYAAKSLVSPNRAKLVACTDVAGIAVHSPYMHPTLRSFVARVPDRLLREQSQDRLQDPGKICLMRMAERHQLLPTAVIEQPKLAAIDSPIDDWFARELRSQLDRALAGLPFQPDAKHLLALRTRTLAERLYKRHIGSTRVISDAISLLATYGAICGASGIRR